MNKSRSKTGGRIKGTPNKVTADLRAKIQAFLDVNFDTMEAEFDNLEVKDKFNFYIKLIEFAIPKQRQIEDTTLAQLLAMTPEQRDARIKEIQEKINNG